MDNYTLSNAPQVDVSEPLHTIQLDPNTIHMNVKSGSKITNLLSYAQKNFEKDDQKQITWNGSGDALNKVVACAEIMKKRFKNLYQINKIGFIKTEEVWNSKLETLRDIKIVKETPTMCIILSKTPLDSTESGYQTSNTVEEMFLKPPSKSQKESKKNKEAPKQNENDEAKPDESIYVKKKKIKNKNENSSKNKQ